MSTRLLVSAGLVWLAPERLLIQRRSRSADHGAGALELPGGKVEPGEHPRAALARELREEWGAAGRILRVGPILEVLHHCYPSPGPEVVLCVFGVDGTGLGDRWAEQVQPERGAEVLECTRTALPVAEFLPADRAFVEAVRGGQYPWTGARGFAS